MNHFSQTDRYNYIMKKEGKSKKEKNCFVITPIGSDNSPTRNRVIQWDELIYKPALEDEYNLILSHEIAAPGIITEQIVRHVAYDDLAIIDYTDLNPNVMYEAAIRHLSLKPLIQIMPNTVKLPFDLHNWRAIPYDPYNLQYPAKLCQDIKKANEEIHDPNYKVPELLPIKFDFDKIISDPLKFVEILKQHLISPMSTDPSIIEVYDSPSMMGSPTLVSGSLLGGMQKVRCPQCGTLKDFPSSGSNVAMYGTVFGMNKHYLCNVCGTEFS